MNDEQRKAMHAKRNRPQAPRSPAPLSSVKTEPPAWTVGLARMDNEQAIEALGGMRALSTMIGASDFVSLDGRGLRFRFKGNRKANAAAIYLGTDDLYRIRILQTGMPVREVAYEDGIYADNLQERFEALTGLSLTMPRFGGHQ